MNSIAHIVPTTITSLLGDSELGRRFLMSTIGSVAIRGIGAIATFLIGIQLARYLGPEGYGVYGLVISMVAILAIPSQCGIPLLLTREIPAALARQNWGEVQGIARWSAKSVTILSVMTVLLGYLALNAWIVPGGESTSGPFVLGLLLLPVLALTNVAGSGLRGFHRVVLGQAPDIAVRPILFSILLFLGMNWFGKITPSEAIVAHGIAAIAALIFAWVIYQKTASKFESAPPKVIFVARWLFSGLRMAAAEGLRIVDGHSAVLLLGILASAEGVGHYRVAVSVAMFAVLPIAILNSVAGPLVSKLNAVGDSDRLRYLAAIVAAAMTAGVAALAFPFFVAGDKIIGAIFGVEFLPAVNVLLLLLFAQFIHSIFGISSTFLNMSGYEGRVVRALSISLPANLLGIVCFVPHLGIEGAALAYICGQFVWNFVMWRDAKRLTGIDTSLISLALLFRARQAPR